MVKKRQSTNTGHTMNKKDKGQAQAIQYTKKHKGKAQVIQCAKKVKDKHRPYNVQKRQRTNTGNTMDRKDKGQTQAT